MGNREIEQAIETSDAIARALGWDWAAGRLIGVMGAPGAGITTIACHLLYMLGGLLPTATGFDHASTRNFGQAWKRMRRLPMTDRYWPSVTRIRGRSLASIIDGQTVAVVDASRDESFRAELAKQAVVQIWVVGDETSDSAIAQVAAIVRELPSRGVRAIAVYTGTHRQPNRPLPTRSHLATTFGLPETSASVIPYWPPMRGTAIDGDTVWTAPDANAPDAEPCRSAMTDLVVSAIEMLGGSQGRPDQRFTDFVAKLTHLNPLQPGAPLPSIATAAQGSAPPPSTWDPIRHLTPVIRRYIDPAKLPPHRQELLPEFSPLLTQPNARTPAKNPPRRFRLMDAAAIAVHQIETSTGHSRSVIVRDAIRFAHPHTANLAPTALGPLPPYHAAREATVHVRLPPTESDMLTALATRLGISENRAVEWAILRYAPRRSPESLA